MDEVFESDLAAFTTWLAEDQQLDAKTVRAYRRAVVSYAEWFAWHRQRAFTVSALDAQDLQRWLADEDPVGIRGQHHRPAPATRNKHIAGLRVFSRWALESGRILQDVARHLEFLVIAPQAAKSLTWARTGVHAPGEPGGGRCLPPQADQ